MAKRTLKENVDLMLESINDIKDTLVLTTGMPENTPVTQFNDYMNKASYTYTKSNNIAVITACSITAETITLPPASIFDCETITLGNGSSGVFNSAVKNVILNDDVTYIRSYAFRNNSDILNINLPSSLQILDTYAFYGMTNLDNIYYNGTPSNWAKVQTKGQYSNGMAYATSFYFNNEKLTEVELTGVNTINAYAFYNFKQLTKLTLDSISLTSGSSAFLNCQNLNTVNYIGNISNWLSFTFSQNSSNPMIYASNFLLNGFAVENIEIPSNILTIKSFSLYNFKNLKTLTLHNAITNLGNNALTNCIELLSIKLPLNITLGNNVFSNCSKLTIDASNYFLASTSWPNNWNNGRPVTWNQNKVFTNINWEELTSITFPIDQQPVIFLNLNSNYLKLSFNLFNYSDQLKVIINDYNTYNVYQNYDNIISYNNEGGNPLIISIQPVGNISSFELTLSQTASLLPFIPEGSQDLGSFNGIGFEAPQGSSYFHVQYGGSYSFFFESEFFGVQLTSWFLIEGNNYTSTEVPIGFGYISEPTYIPDNSYLIISNQNEGYAFINVQGSGGGA